MISHSNQFINYLSILKTMENNYIFSTALRSKKNTVLDNNMLEIHKWNKSINFSKLMFIVLVWGIISLIPVKFYSQDLINLKNTTLIEADLVFKNEIYDSVIRIQVGYWPVFSNISDVKKTNPMILKIEKYHQTTIYSERSIISNYIISPDQNQIVYCLKYCHKTARFRDEPHVWRDYYELYYYKKNMIAPIMIGQTGSFSRNVLSCFVPVYWINNSSILLEALGNGTPNPLGIAIYNISTFTGASIPINKRYISTPRCYRNSTKLFYYVLDGNEPVNKEQLVGNRLMYSYDIVDGIENQIYTIPEDMETDNLMTNSLYCYLYGSPIFNLPWPCNKAMCVERDGPQPCAGSSCDMSNHDINTEYSDCYLIEGSSYTGACNLCPTQTCGHTRPAIDFGDAGLWFQTGTPVLASADGYAQKRYEASGAGNYVIIRSPKTGGGWVYSYYMHLSQVAQNIPQGPSNWVPIYRGDQLGLEGGTGGNYSPHYHFELKDAIGGNSYYPIFHEYGGCTPKTGRTYISRNIPTDGSIENGFDCNSVIDICPNTALTSQTTVGTASRYATYGNGYHSWDEYGPERLYRLTMASSGSISVSLSNVSYSVGNDLDVFILTSTGDCADLDPIANCVGNSQGLTSNYANAPTGTYYIVVDGSNGSTGSYTLNVNVNYSNNLNQNTSIVAPSAGYSVSVCQLTAPIVYYFRIIDDCDPIDISQIQFNGGGSGLPNLNGIGFFSIDQIGGPNHISVAVTGNVSPGIFFPFITYQGIQVSTGIWVYHNGNQPADIILPVNLTFTVPQCQTSVEATTSITIIDDCDNPIVPSRAYFTLGGVTLTPTFINAATGYFEFTLNLTQTEDGDLLVARYTDAQGAVRLVDALINVTGLPCGWSQQPNGINCNNGSSVSYTPSSQVFTITSTNCYSTDPFTSDAMAFAQRSLCGDGSITAQITTITNSGSGWAGVVLRESTAAGAKKVQLMTNLGSLHRREVRYTTGGASYPQQTASNQRHWLRIVRQGSQFIAYASPNGAQWYQVMSATVAMNSCIEMGLVVTNNQPTGTVTATFANVSTTGNSSGLLPPGINEQLYDPPLTLDFSLFPNPTTNEVNINLSAYSGRPVRIELYTPQGQQLRFVEIQEVQTAIERLDLSAFANGMYWIKVKTPGLPDVTKRVVLTGHSDK